MHELDITKDLIKKIKSLAKDNNIKEGNVIIEIGKLSTFSRKPIEFYFEQFTAKDDFFKDRKLKLTINEAEGRIKCNDCKKESTIDNMADKYCPECLSFNTEIISGRDVMIRKIEF